MSETSELGIVVGFLVLTESGLHIATSAEALYDGDFVRTFEGECARAATLNDSGKASSFTGAERLLARRDKLLKRLAEER